MNATATRAPFEPELTADDYVTLAETVSRADGRAVDHYWTDADDVGFMIVPAGRGSTLLDKVNAEAGNDWIAAAVADAPYYGDERAAILDGVQHDDDGLFVYADAHPVVLSVAVGILHALADYPVLSDDRYSTAEHEAVGELWSRASVSDRLEMIERHGAGEVSPMAARRDTVPSTDNRLYAHMTDVVNEAQW